jgi:DNA-directed RNA polymerase subunit M/transcription elongation factor TFIIS
MDDYSQQTIKLLLETDKTYLFRLLRQLDIEVDDDDDEKQIGQMLENQKTIDPILHKSSIYTCQCGSNNVITREIQTRSADEGSTIVHICLKCSRTWK